MSAIRSLAVRLVSTAAGLAAGLTFGIASVNAESTWPWSSESASPKPAASTTSSTQSASASPVTLPNGATSLAEVYGDWTVSCGIQSNTKHCDAKQEQINQQNRQLVLAVDLVPVDDRIEGVALLPFGLALEDGITLQIDDLPAGPTVQFKTCLPSGCVAPLSFDSRAAASLRSGTMLKAKVVVEGGGETVLSISLKGFSQAIDRTAVLAPTAHDQSEKIASRSPSAHSRR